MKIVIEITKHIPEYSKLILKKIKKYDLNGLNESLIKFVYSLLNALLLKAICNDINASEFFKDFDLELYLNEDSINYRYAKDVEILNIFRAILNKKELLDIKLQDLRKIISVGLEKENYITNKVGNLEVGSNQNDINLKVIEKFERVMYKKIQDVEIDTRKVINSMLRVSDSYLNFSFMDDLKKILHDIYGYSNSWIAESVSVYDMIALLLDYYYLGFFNIDYAISSFEVVQFIKFERMAIYSYLYRYVLYLPILNEIRNRCFRSGDGNSKELYYYQFNLFVGTYKKRNNSMKIFCDMYDIKLKLLMLSYMMIDAYQKHSDYFFLLEKIIKDRGLELSAEQYINYCKDLYDKIIYC